jgi:hypothetical protein
LLSAVGIEGLDAMQGIANASRTLVHETLLLIAPLYEVYNLYKMIAGDGKVRLDHTPGGHILTRNVLTSTTTTTTTTTPKGGRTGGGRTTPKIENPLPEGSVAALNKELSELQKKQQLATDPEGWNRLQEAIDGVTKKINYIKGKEEEIDFDKMFPMKQEITSSKSIGEKMLEGIIGDIAGGIQDADTSTLKNLLQVVIENGLQGIDIPADSIMEKILGDGADIPDEYWQSLQDEINAKLQELGIEPIKIDFKTGNISKDGEKAKDSWQDAAKAVQSLGSAMQNIEDPAAKVAGTVLQAVANVALGYANALTMAKEAGGPWGWIAFAATGLATMITTISAIHSATGYAQGGIVKGNSYSGDNVPAMVGGAGGELVGLNAGEVVLTKAMQSNLASQLQNGGGAGSYSPSHISGEQIYIVLNRYTKRSGKGEIVTWR